VLSGEFIVTLSYSIECPSFYETKPMEVFENPREAKRYENALFSKNNRKIKKFFYHNTVQNEALIGIEDFDMQG